MKLVRDFIRDSLYTHSKGYFSVTDCVLSPRTPIEFTKLLGYGAYVKTVNNLYKQNSGSWLTPVEVFQPWYSRGIASYILETHRNSQSFAKTPLQIFEIGGGNGTNARCILDYIKEKCESTYENTSYTLIEISDTMSERQSALLEPLHPSKCRFVCNDILEWNSVHQDPCFVVAMEVLDNLPHDKLVRNIEGTSLKGEEWCNFNVKEKDDWFQVEVSDAAQEAGYEEMLEPLTDALAIQTAEYFIYPPERKKEEFPSFIDFIRQPIHSLSRLSRRSIYLDREKIEKGDESSQFRKVFIPTGAVKFIDVLHSKFPKHSLIAADFDELPPPDIPVKSLLKSSQVPGSLVGCLNAPLVSGDSEDYPSYLHKPGTADIFFRTDFEAMKDAYLMMHDSMSNPTSEDRKVDVLTQKSFLSKYAEHNQTRTRNGYNPMLEDYQNTKVFLGYTALSSKTD